MATDKFPWAGVINQPTGAFSPNVFPGTGQDVINGPNMNLSSGQTAMTLVVYNNAGVNLVSVTLGAVDSGGAGFRLLRVPN